MSLPACNMAPPDSKTLLGQKDNYRVYCLFIEVPSSNLDSYSMTANVSPKATGPCSSKWDVRNAAACCGRLKTVMFSDAKWRRETHRTSTSPTGCQTCKALSLAQKALGQRLFVRVHMKPNQASSNQPFRTKLPPSLHPRPSRSADLRSITIPSKTPDSNPTRASEPFRPHFVRGPAIFHPTAANRRNRPGGCRRLSSWRARPSP